MGERLQKVLARCGYGSRRQIEDWVRAGRITVNGIAASLGDHIEIQDTVRIDGRLLRIARHAAPSCKVLAYHKREGEMSTRSDPQGRTTIFEHLPRLRGGRWVAVGRLDLTTSGLILLTTDGELAHRLMHPARGLEREYAVRVLGRVDDAMLARLKSGVTLEDGAARFEFITDAGGRGVNHWYHVVLKEGRNREVRRLWESQGVKVSRLIRVRYGPVPLPPGLRAGQWRELDGADVEALRRAAGLE